MKLLQTARGLPRPASLSAAVLFSLLITPAVTLPAQTPTPAQAATADETVILSPFNVSTTAADRYRAEDAISAVRVRAALIDTPSSISVITRGMMDDLMSTRVFDVTRYVAGVQEGRGIQFQDRMIIRGFETQGGARTVDNFLQSADADNVEESIIDRIEVTKGPNAILSPAGAPGGSLNIITKSPTFRAQGSLMATIGLFDAQKITLDMGGPLGNSKDFAYRLIGSWQDTRQYWSAEAKTKHHAFAPMFTWRISDKTQLTTKLVAAEMWVFREPALILDPNTTADTSNPQIGPGFSYRGLNGTQPWSHNGTHNADLFTTLTSSLNEHISLRVAANARYYFTDADQEFVNGLPGLTNRYNPMTGQLTQNYTWALANSSLPYNATTNPYVSTYSPYYDPTSIPVRGQIQWTRLKTANFQMDGLFKYKFGPIDSQTVMGYGYGRQLADNRVKDPGTLPSINLTQPIPSVYPVYPVNLTQDNGSSYLNQQTYINQRFGFFDNRLFVTGGYLHYATLTKSWNVLTHSVPAVLDDSKNLTNISALWKVRDNVSVYYSHSINSSPVIANNLPLWKNGEQSEYGFKTEFFNHKLSINGAYFKIAQTNVTVPNPAYQNDPTQPQQLISDLKNKGFEFEIMGSITNDLSVLATYSHLNMRDNLGRMVRGVADNNASMLLNYRFNKDSDLKGLSLYAGVNYSSKRAGDIPINFTPLGVVGQVSFYLKPEYVNTIGASYRVNDRLTFRLTIDNVLDETNYIAVAGARSWGSGLTTATGRNIRFTTTINF
ncbi:MAG TPA: TonB-dependent receptor plug domain-containing protein [Opitutaceae bacterium]|nr:TonB-dependent receptor plug domain-containing protein [Opitutaceae bacterium]